MKRGKNLFQQVLGIEPEAGCIDAGMAGEERALQNIPVDEQADTVFRIKNKA